jgi:hypothetical protein
MKRKLLPNLLSLRHDKKAAPEQPTDFIYVLGTQDGLVKIGTTNDLWGRFKKLRGMSPKPLQPLMFWACRRGKTVEAALHAIFHDYRRHGEWFEFGHPDATYARWKYRHLALSALFTCAHPPVPIDASLLGGIQIEHVPENDPIWDVPGGGDWTDKACYPPDLFAGFYPAENDTFRLLDWPEETRQLYGFG